MIATICRKAHFNAAHRLDNPDWSEEKNKEVFGICNNPYYHGHNFELEVRIRGEINPNTGFIIDMSDLGKLVKIEIEDRFDHKNLNLDCPEFKGIIASTENFARIIYQILKAKIGSQFQLHVTLHETAKNAVEYGDW